MVRVLTCGLLRQELLLAMVALLGFSNWVVG